MKTCTHCGVDKPSTEFRKYYNRPGTYSMCKECQGLEYKYSRLKNMNRNEKQQREFEMLEVLFERRRDAGLITPGIKARREQYNQERLLESIKAAGVLTSPIGGDKYDA